MKILIIFFKSRFLSFKYAFNGLKIIFTTETNAIIHLVVGFLVLLLSFYIQIHVFEWIAIIFSIGFVVVTEIINTAIEKLCDFIHPNKNENIKIIKDITAAAVLISVVVAILIGFLVLVPKIIKFLH